MWGGGGGVVGGAMREGLHVGLPEQARCDRTGQGCLTLESQAVATLWGLEPLRGGELKNEDAILFCLEWRNGRYG